MSFLLLREGKKWVIHLGPKRVGRQGQYALILLPRRLSPYLAGRVVKVKIVVDDSIAEEILRDFAPDYLKNFEGGSGAEKGAPSSG